MKTIKFGLMGAFSMLLFASCGDECAENPPTILSSHERIQAWALERALKEADNFLELLSNENNRPARGLSKKIIEPITIHTTRSHTDTIFYIINYDNGNGFAVLSTNPNLETIQAISTNGNLHISDTLDNKGLAAFFKMLELKSLDVSVHGETRSDYPIGSFEPNTDGYFIRNVSTSQHGPLLSAIVRKWDQDSPYNKYCPNVAKEPAFKAAKVGCMALSASQIMTYYEFPPVINSIKIDWESLKNHNSDTTYRLLSYIGETLDLKYGATVSIGYEDRIVPMFKSLGYSLSESPKKFKQNIALTDISKYGPLLVYSNFTSTGMGHAWVIDGWHSTTYEEKVIGEDTKPTWQNKTSILFHCVWGEISGANGYYRWSEANNAIGGPSPESTEEDDKKSGKGYLMKNIHYYTFFNK